MSRWRNKTEKQIIKTQVNWPIIVTAIAAALSFILSVVACIQTEKNHNEVLAWQESVQQWNKQQANAESYKEQLNYVIKWSLTNDKATIIQNESEIGNTVKLPNTELNVSAITGGVKSVGVIFFLNGECNAYKKIDQAEWVKIEENRSTDMMYKCAILTMYADQIGPSSRSGSDKSYYTHLFVEVEGYNNDRYVSAFVFEYPIENENKLDEDKFDVREYSKTDLLYLQNNNQTEQIPDYDYRMLKDYETLLNRLDDLP